MPWGAVASIGAAVIGGVASNNAAKKAAEANQKAIDANAWQGQIATDQYDNYKKNYLPLEQKLVSDANAFDSDDAYNKAAGDAQATVSNQLALARAQLQRTPGFDPSSAAAQTANANLAIKGAALGATAQNRARADTKERAFARRLDVAGLGRGLVSNASTGMAAASANAASIARNSSQEAAQTASGMGAMVGGVVNGLSKVNWGNFGIGGSGGTGSGVVINDGQPIHTQVPAGSSGYADGLGGGV